MRCLCVRAEQFSARCSGRHEIHRHSLYPVLAVHIAVSKLPEEDAEASASFLKGFLLQFVNVKIYLFGITALTGYVTDYSTSFWVLCGFELVIATIGSIATMTWVGMGLLIQTWYRKYFRAINIILALTLLECVVSILFS